MVNDHASQKSVSKGDMYDELWKSMREKIGAGHKSGNLIDVVKNQKGINNFMDPKGKGNDLENGRERCSGEECLPVSFRL